MLARRAQRMIVSARRRSTPSRWNHHDGRAASRRGSGGRSRPPGPGAAGDRRWQSVRHERRASSDVTRWARMVGTSALMTESQRPMRRPGAAAKARATTSWGTSSANGASSTPTSRGTRSSSQPAPGPHASWRSRLLSHQRCRVPAPSGVRVARQTWSLADACRRVVTAVLEQAEGVPQVEWTGGRWHSGQRTGRVPQMGDDRAPTRRRRIAGRGPVGEVHPG